MLVSSPLSGCGFLCSEGGFPSLPREESASVKKKIIETYYVLGTVLGKFKHTISFPFFSLFLLLF